MYVPQGCVEKYQSLQYWNDFGKILELVETGIASSTIKADNSLDVIYDLSGKKYGDLYKTKSKGIYIRKGKKFIVK